MQIDQEYLRQILNSFIDSPRSFIWIADIMEHGIEIDDKFLFHMQILEDQRFIECLDKKSDLGYEILLGGEFRWSSRHKPARNLGRSQSRVCRRVVVDAALGRQNPAAGIRQKTARQVPGTIIAGRS